MWSNNIHSHMSVGIASTNEAAYFAWQDTRNGNYENEAEDVYSASALHGDGPAAASSATSSSVTWSVLGGGVGLALAGLVLLIGMRFAKGASAPVPAPARGGSR